MNKGKEVYRASIDSDSRPYVQGPGPGLDYYGGTLWRELRFVRPEDAERAARIANIAYAEGYGKAQQDIQKALGIMKG